jgi:hypothetical protein
MKKPKETIDHEQLEAFADFFCHVSRNCFKIRKSRKILKDGSIGILLLIKNEAAKSLEFLGSFCL